MPVLSQSAPDPAALDAALERIEAERMQEVKPIQKLQAQPPKVVLSRAWWGEPARRILARALGSERFRERAGDRVSVFPFGITEVNLQV